MSSNASHAHSFLEGLACNVGVADLDLTQLRELYQWARVKPSTNQLHFESATALSAEMTEFAAEHNIQLLSHADDMATAGPVNVRRMLASFKGIILFILLSVHMSDIFQSCLPNILLFD